MVKLLRKYNKWLLAGFGSFLLVTWLVSGPGTFGGDPRKRVVATVGGEKIIATDMQHAELEYRAVKELLPGIVTGRVGIESGVHWMLLTMQATKAGLVAEKGDGEAWINDAGGSLVKEEAQYEVLGNPQYRSIAEYILNNPQMMSQFTQQTQQRLTLLKDRARGPLQPDEFHLALAKLRGVMRLVDSFQYSPRFSDVRLADEVGKLSTRISFDAVEIPADKVPGVDAPSEAKLAEMFDRYKAVKKGTGEFGFGYEQPKRVKLEWMKIDRAAVTASVSLDPIEVNKHWQQNRTTFKGEFAAEKVNVEKALRDSKVDAAFAETDRVVRARIRSATRNLENAGGVKKLPADWDSRRPTMEQLATTVVTEVASLKMPMPRVEVRASEFTPVEETRTIADLAGVQFRVGTQSGAIDEFLGQTFELSGTNNLGLQAGVPFEQPLTDGQGDRFYVTVLEARKESPAESLEKIIDRVKADAKRQAAYEKLKTEAAGYQVQAITDGLEVIARTFATPVPVGAPADAVPTPLPIDRRVTINNAQGDPGYPQYDTTDLRSSLEAQIDLLGHATKVSPDNVAQRTLTVPLPARQSLAVIQITGHEPLSQETMRTVTLAAARNLSARELREQLKDEKVINPFDMKSLKEQMAYVNLERSESDEQKAAPKKGA